MSVTNDFLPFAIGGSANVESQVDYAADSNRTNGNQPGIASSSFNNKAIRQANFITSQLAQMVANTTGTNVNDNGVTAQFLAQLNAAIQALPPQVTTHLTGTGTHHLTFAFFTASANATAAATYTDSNSNVFTVRTTISAGTLLSCFATSGVAPAVSGTLTKTGGTGDSTIAYYATRAPISMDVFMVGGGGGGSGSGGTTGTAATAGAATTFGTTLLSAGGGGAGTFSNAGGNGGTSSLGSGPVGLALPGSVGSGYSDVPALVSSASLMGGPGGNSAIGGGGAGGSDRGAGIVGATNSGGGGGGGGGVLGSSQYTTGSGGGSGGFVDATIIALLVSYGWVVGTAGAGGAAGTTPTGFGGGNGAQGLIRIIERYQ